MTGQLRLMSSARIRLCRLVRWVPSNRAAPATFQPAWSRAWRMRSRSAASRTTIPRLPRWRRVPELHPCPIVPAGGSATGAPAGAVWLRASRAGDASDGPPLDRGEGVGAGELRPDARRSVAARARCHAQHDGNSCRRRSAVTTADCLNQLPRDCQTLRRVADAYDLGCFDDETAGWSRTRIRFGGKSPMCPE